MKKKTAIERRGRKNTKEEENEENNCNKEKEKGGEVKINELIVSSRHKSQHNWMNEKERDDKKKGK